MVEVLLSAAIGYGLGQLNPSALISTLKKRDLREHGTGNLGETNTFLVFGKVYGIAVMIFDVLKAYFAIQIAKKLFPLLKIAGLIAGCFAVIGHIFPAYLEFRGGKGVATFAGLILAYDVRALVIILLVAIVVMAVTDFGTWGPVSAAVLFPAWLLFRIQNLMVFGGVVAVGSLVIYRHKDNFARAKQGNEILVREFSRKYDELHHV